MGTLWRRRMLLHRRRPFVCKWYDVCSISSVGGPDLPDVCHLSDKELYTIAIDELCALLAIRGQPTTHHISRHVTGMPQYHLGHGDVVKEIESRTSKLPGLELAGNAYHGVGIPNCIQSGEQAAERVLATLGISHAPALSSEPLTMV